jgi:hypothetical protein
MERYGGGDERRLDEPKLERTGAMAIALRYWLTTPAIP